MIRQSFISYLSDNHSLKYHYYNDGIFRELPHSVKVEMTFNENHYESWGVSTDFDLAFFKAFMELIERVSLDRVCSFEFSRARFLSRKISLAQISQKFGLSPSFLFPNNSNGVAININSKKAMKAAFEELLERHVLLCALLLNVPPQRFESSDINLKVEGHSTSFYYWKSQGYFIAMAVDSIRNGGFLFTHACSKDLEKAIKKASEELTPNIIYSEKVSDLDVDYSIRVNDIKSFRRYWKFSRDARMKDFLDGKLGRGKNTIPELEDVFYASIPVPELFKKELPMLECYRAISPQAQQLFFDSWDISYVNPLYREIVNLPSFPHMIS